MVQVSFIQPDGSRETVTANAGETVMDAALDNGIAGIKAQCGGGCTCCTCHCWVREPWFEQLPPPHQDERDMLEYAWGKELNSRLSCQIELTERLDGIELDVPLQQS